MHIFSSRLPKKSGFKLGVAEYGAQTNQPNKPVAQLCPTLGDPMDWSLPGSSVHGIFQARVLEWVAISFSSGAQVPFELMSANTEYFSFFRIFLGVLF